VKATSTSGNSSVAVGTGGVSRASATVAQPTPIFPCRGQPVKNPIAIATSSADSCARNAASFAILSSRPDDDATAFDV
jgi:hypothetical protein